MAEPQVNPAHLTVIPPAIKRQAERADALQRESIGQPPAGDVAPGATSGTEPPQPVASAPPGSPTEAVAPQQPPVAPAGDDLAAQLRMTQGRLDAERERSQQQIGEIASLRRMVDDLQRQIRTAPPPSAPTELPRPPQGKLVTAQEEADYGAELLAVVGKRARDEVSDEISELKNQIKSLEGIVGQVGSRVANRDANDVFTELHRQVPNWVNQNADPEFIAWLQQPEPFSGIKRHDLLSTAFDRHDASRVIKFFQGYLDEAAATGQAPAPTTPSSGTPPTNGKVPLETFAAPGRAAPAPASAPPGQKPTYTRAQIAGFYTDKAAGKWRGREAEATQIEADLFRAGPEGRVIG